jgi:hypothetical protein
MAVAFKLKRSSVSGRAPDTSSIDYGELAINTFDGVLYFKKNDGNSDSVVPIRQVTEYNLAIDNTPISNSSSNNLSGILRDLDRAISINNSNINSSFEVGADDSTIRTVNSGESISFLGANGVSTSSDVEGSITITGPDLSSYVTNTATTNLNLDGNNIVGVDTLRIDETGSGLRMTNVGAFDNNSGNFRVFATSSLELLSGGSSGKGLSIATSGAVTFNDEFTLPTTDGANGQTLVTNGNGTVTWRTLSGAGGAATLDGLLDVDTTTTEPEVGQVLKYDGTNWVPEDSSGGDPSSTENFAYHLIYG